MRDDAKYFDKSLSDDILFCSPTLDINESSKEQWYSAREILHHARACPPGAYPQEIKALSVCTTAYDGGSTSTCHLLDSFD